MLSFVATSQRYEGFPTIRTSDRPAVDPLLDPRPMGAGEDARPRVPRAVTWTHHYGRRTCAVGSTYPTMVKGAMCGAEPSYVLSAPKWGLAHRPVICEFLQDR